MVNKVLGFLDFGKKRNGKPTKFSTSNWKVEVRKGRRFAVATAPSGVKAFRILGKA